jgi:MtN3 and saliva related transmembrane protein
MDHKLYFTTIKGGNVEPSVIIGSIAAVATTISFIPQAVKVLTTRDTRSISLLMYLVFSVGVSLWLVYGILRKDIPVACANGVTLLLALVILYCKIREKRT